MTPPDIPSAALAADLSCPAELPIAACWERIVAAIKASPVVIVAGEPGSGKTTQLPKMCLAAGRGRRRKIGCTQPRRIAAISMAARLGEELGPAGEELVGYRIRFADHTSRNTRVKFMTDGILLAEAQHDRQLRDYDTIIVDEAHERSLNIDFLLGILKDLLGKRPDLKVIITSATIDTEKFSRHFGQAPVIQVAGRTHPVEVRHRGPTDPKEEPAAEEQSYTDQAVAAVLEIIREEPPGDILVFMPTERDIRETADSLEQAWQQPGGGTDGKAVIMPLYGRLSPKEQRRIFQPAKGRGRKIVIATNVAETSITVPGIRYVVDTGLARVAAYNPRARTYKLPVVPVARSACDQRAGRCGRVGPGVCIRLYAEEDYLNRPLYTPPEIVRSNLAEVILRMTALKLGDPAAFPFVDPPSARAIKDGYQLLAELGALETPADNRGEVSVHQGYQLTGLTGRNRSAVPQIRASSQAQRTPGTQAWLIARRCGAVERLQGEAMKLSRRGRLMSRLPLDPCIARMIIEARENNALREVCVIAAALSIQDPRIRPTDKEKEADQVHRRFSDRGSDFLFYLNLWDTMQGVLAQTGSKGRLRKFCQGHFLSFQRLREWQDIHEQISRILHGEKGFTINTAPASAEAIHKSLLSGNLRNIAQKKEKNLYQGGGGREVVIFPGSSLYHRGGGRSSGSGEVKKVSGHGVPPPTLMVAASPSAKRTSVREPARSRQPAVPRDRLPLWIMAAELVETNRLYARTVAAIEPEWIEPLARPLMRYSYSDPHWEKRRGQVVVREKGTLFGLVVVAGRKVPLAHIDQPEARRIFIQSALVEGELKGNYRFLEANRQLLESLRDLEERSRRRDLLVAEENIADFYHRLLPAEVYDQAGLNRLLKKRRDDDFLQLRREDLLSRQPADDLLEQFPATLTVGEVELELIYHFEPGAEDDGLSVMIPVHLSPHLRPQRFEWLVPGMLEEKIFFLLKNLPKNLRRQLVPIPATAAELARRLQPGNVSLYQALGRAIYEMFGLRLEAAAWPVKELPAHLRCRFCLLDDRGRILAAGRNLSALVGGGAQKAALPEKAVANLRRRWEQDDLKAADLPEIPERLPVTGPDGQLAGYLFPGLRQEQERVELHLFEEAEAARRATRRGLLALYHREFTARLKTLRQDLRFPPQQWRLAQGLGSLDQLNRAIEDFVLREIFAVAPGRVPAAAEFQAQVARLRRDGFYREARRLYELILEVLQQRWEVIDAIGKLTQPVAAGRGTGKKQDPVGQGGLQGLAALVAARERAAVAEQAARPQAARAGQKVGPSSPSQSLAEELQGELATLVPADFPAPYDAATLARLPYHLKALRIRAERARTDPAKDAAKAAQLAPFRHRLAKYPDQAALPERKRELLAEYRQMLAEYKISLFAQEIKTSFPVSPQRLEEKWREVEEVL